MAGPILLSVERTLTDVKGQIAGNGSAPAPPTITTQEALAPLTDALSGLVSGGVHPEGAPLIVDKAPTVATQSRPGPTGGLVPRLASVQSPGPAGLAAGLLQRFRRP